MLKPCWSKSKPCGTPREK